MERPRGLLAQALFKKLKNDSYLDELDYTQWYSIEFSNDEDQLSTKYKSKFLDLVGPDEITMNWMETAKQKSHKLCNQLWHFYARLLFSFFLSQTDLNGILKRGSMFICSENQFTKLLVASGFFEKLNNNETTVNQWRVLNSL